VAGPLGVVLPDRRWRSWAPEELGPATELGPSACVVPVYGEQPTEARAAQVAAARALAGRTGARILLLAREPDLPGWAPNDWAGECARRAGFFTGVGGMGVGNPHAPTPVEMIPGNELNSVAEGGSAAWATGAGPSWLLRFAQRYRRLRRGERLHLPAPASGGDGREAVAFWEACARAGVGKRFDVVDVHAHSEEQVRTLPRLAHETLGLPVDVTECTGAAPVVVAAVVRAHPWLGSACYAVGDWGGRDARAPREG
jgi:hypothetical protein